MKTEDIKNIARAWQQVQEKLTGGQKKLDMDKDGDIDAKDFAHMRNKKKTNEDEVVMNPKKDKKEKKDANSEVSQDMSNEAKIDEISKKTLGSYVKKASSDMANNAYALGARDPLKKPGSWDKAFKRKAGIAKATDKLTKEEVELDEVSQETLRQYHGKAGADLLKKRDMVAKGKLTMKDLKKGQNRVKGLNRAAAKMEEVETWPVYNRLMEKDAHTKGATPPEAMDSKASGKEKEFRAKHKTDVIDNPEAPGSDIAKATNAAPSKKARPGDNPQSDKMQKPVDTTK